MHGIIVNIVYLINIYDLRVNKISFIGRQISMIYRYTVYLYYIMKWKKNRKALDEYYQSNLSIILKPVLCDLSYIL